MSLMTDPLWAMAPETFAAFSAEFASLDLEARAFGESDSGESAPYAVTGGSAAGIATIPIEGVIARTTLVNRATGATVTTGMADIQAMLTHALGNPDVRGVLFSIHSPGGQAYGIKELADSISTARRVKPCAAWVDGQCTSAAFWLAAATGAVFAGPSAVVGSIGVLYRHLDLSGLNKNIGINCTYVTAGSHKAVGNADTPLSERDRDILQGHVNALYDLFTTDVSRHMGLDPEALTTWADGRIFLGREAERIGLVTGIVPGLAAAQHQLTKEIHMDTKELAAKYPDAVAAMRAEIETSALEAVTAKASATAQDTENRLMAVVKAVAGDDVATRVSAIAATGVSADQLTALLPLMAPATPAASTTTALPAASTSANSDAAAKILAGIVAATPGALPTGGGQPVDPEAEALKAIAAIK